MRLVLHRHYKSCHHVILIFVAMIIAFVRHVILIFIAFNIITAVTMCILIFIAIRIAVTMQFRLLLPLSLLSRCNLEVYCHYHCCQHVHLDRH